MSEIRAEAKRVSCLGPEGSYSHLAAEKMCEGYKPVFCRDFVRVVGALERGGTDCAVLPVENAVRGAVLQSLDLLEASDVYAVKELTLPVDHRLALKAGAKRENVKYIYSHEQAIGQCSAYLEKYFPDAQYVHTSSTAQSLSLLSETAAGIVGSHVKAEGVILSEENIADVKNNCTRFLRLVRREEGLPDGKLIFAVAVLEHRAGALNEFLNVFTRSNVNLTRIESRPVKERFGEYRFFIEFAGSVEEERIGRVLREAQKSSKRFRLLGAY